MTEKLAGPACGTCLGSGTEAHGYPGKDGPWDIPTCRTCGGSGKGRKGEGARMSRPYRVQGESTDTRVSTFATIDAALKAALAVDTETGDAIIHKLGADGYMGIRDGTVRELVGWAEREIRETRQKG